EIETQSYWIWLCAGAGRQHIVLLSYTVVAVATKLRNRARPLESDQKGLPRTFVHTITRLVPPFKFPPPNKLMTFTIIILQYCINIYLLLIQWKRVRTIGAMLFHGVFNSLELLNVFLCKSFSIQASTDLRRKKVQ